ncbi:MAG: aspartate aminotransferase family protein [Thermoplasmata archaeon]
MSSEDFSEIEHRHVFGTWKAQRAHRPKTVVGAEGVYFTDDKGNRYLDLSSQLIASNLGHGNKAVIAAVQKQIERLQYISPGFTTPQKAELGRLLAEITPGTLDRSFFSTSGTEANEAAIKIARAYTGGYKVISRYRSYHGSTAASISITGDPRRHWVEPAGRMVGALHGPDAYCYRCPLMHEYPDCGIACAEYIRYMIEMEHEDKVAAVVVEPVVGSNGVIVPPDEYLPILREITEETGTLLIADEVMTGFGRTGEWFAVNHWDVVPDIITMAKGLTGSYVPFGATIVSKEIADHFEEEPFMHGHTFTGHSLGAAAALAAIREYKEKGLVENARQLGPYLGKRLKELMERHPSIGDVRGLGLFWGVELVKDREKKVPFLEREDKLKGTQTAVDQVVANAMKEGVYVLAMLSVLLIAPPLTVTKEQIDEGMEGLDKALVATDREAAG